MVYYPSALVTALNLPARVDGIDAVVAGDVNPVYSELVAIEAAVGVVPSTYAPRVAGYTTSTSVFGSLSERVGNLEAGIANRTVDTQGRSTIQPIADVYVPLTIKQYSSSTANLLEIKNSAGTVLNSFTSAGHLTTIDGGTA